MLLPKTKAILFIAIHIKKNSFVANVKVEFKPSLEVKMTDQNKMQEKIKKIIKHSLEKECPNLSCEKELDQALSEIMDIIETDNCQCKDKSQIYLITHCRLCGK